MLAVFFARALGSESDRLDTRSPVYYALAGIQMPAALSERAAYSYQYPGFRFAHRFASPWAEVSYACGVPPEMPQSQRLR